MLIIPIILSKFVWNLLIYISFAKVGI